MALFSERFLIILRAFLWNVSLAPKIGGKSQRTYINDGSIPFQVLPQGPFEVLVQRLGLRTPN